MSENVPNPPVPPSGEPAKVQPKKETVRIALPPKPTAAPTVRLPSPAPAAAGGAAPVASSAAPKAPTPPPAAAAPAGPAAPAKAAAPAAPMTRAAAPAPSGGGVSGLDRGLAVAVAVLSLAFLVHVALIAFGIQVE